MEDGGLVKRLQRRLRSENQEGVSFLLKKFGGAGFDAIPAKTRTTKPTTCADYPIQVFVARAQTA